MLALSWTQASDLKSETEEGNAQLHSNSFVQKLTNIVQPNAKLSGFSSSGNTHILGKPQNDQNTGSTRTPTRRVLKGNRPLPKKSDSTPAREPIPARQILQSAPSDVSSGTGSMNILAGFAGKNRVLVITAPNDSDGYYRLMMTLLKPEVYCEMAERHMQQIVMFHAKGERGGKVRRVSSHGSVVEEPLDPSQVPRLMTFLKLEEGKFGMVLLKKTLQVEETYPYPVQLEAIYEVIDQAPVRRLEKARQKGFVQKCKAAGVEGQVMQSNTAGLQTRVDTAENTGKQNKVRPVPQSTEAAREQMPTTIATTTITTTTKRTTTLKTTTTKPPTTTTSATTAFPSPTTAMTTNVPTTVRQTDPTHQRLPQNQQSTTTLFPTSDFYPQHPENTFTASPTQAHKRRPKNKQAGVKKGWSETVSQREHDTHRPAATKPEKDLTTAQKAKTKADDAERKKKASKSEKPAKKTPSGKKGVKVAKETNVGLTNKKSGHKTNVNEERAVLGQPTDPKKSLEIFLGYFEKRRRLIVCISCIVKNRAGTLTR